MSTNHAMVIMTSIIYTTNVGLIHIRNVLPLIVLKVTITTGKRLKNVCDVASLVVKYVRNRDCRRHLRLVRTTRVRPAQKTCSPFLVWIVFLTHTQITINRRNSVSGQMRNIARHSHVFDWPDLLVASTPSLMRLRGPLLNTILSCFSALPSQSWTRTWFCRLLHTLNVHSIPADANDSVNELPAVLASSQHRSTPIVSLHSVG